MPTQNLNRQLWQLALPMMLANLSTPLLGMVDTAVVGHLDHPYYLGAVALGSTIFSFLYWGFGFLRMGTTGLTAQAWGSGNRSEVNATLTRALLIAFTLAIVLLLVRQPLLAFALHLLEGSSNVELFTRQYFHIRILSAPATLANYVCIGWFIGLQNTRIPLLLTLLVNASNIVFDFLFVWVWHWQVAGVAIASVLAEYLGLMVSLNLVWRRWRHFPYPRRKEILQWSRLRRMFSVNANLFVRTLLLLFSFAFFTAQSAPLGDVVLAANTILLNLQSFMAYTLDGFAHAAEALVGQALGRGDLSLLRRSIHLSGLWTFAFAGFFSLIYAVAGDRIILLLTSLEPVYGLAVQFLHWAVVLPLFSAWSFVLDGVFIGLTRAREMRNVMIASVIFGYLPLWWYLRPLNNQGLWTAFTAFMMLRSLGMEFYRRQVLRRLLHKE